MQIREFIPGVELHHELNPLIWDGDRLKPQVRLSLEHTAMKFELFLGFPVKVEDVIITGSQTAYTYTAASDIDLHLIVAYQNIQCDQPVQELFDTKRRLWKEEHDIEIYGIPVECYVEDTARPVEGHSYSILKDQWLRQPRPLSDHSLPPGVIAGTAAWVHKIKAAIETRDLAELGKTKTELKDYRARGLGSEGEMGTANLVFKTLRNNGVIGDLMKTIRRLEDRNLSLG
jgi:hypothetical protein